MQRRLHPRRANLTHNPQSHAQPTDPCILSVPVTNFYHSVEYVCTVYPKIDEFGGARRGICSACGLSNRRCSVTACRRGDVAPGAWRGSQGCHVLSCGEGEGSGNDKPCDCSPSIRWQAGSVPIFWLRRVSFHRHRKTCTCRKFSPRHRRASPARTESEKTCHTYCQKKTQRNLPKLASLIVGSLGC